MQQDEILFIDAKCKYKGKEYHLNDIIFKYQGSLQYWNFLELRKKRNITDPVQLYDINIKVRLGFANKTKSYRLAVKTDREVRNVVTGQYN